MTAKRIIIVGPGGSGKDHLAKQLAEHGYKRAVSCTTRPPRSTEVDGVDYRFITGEEFRKRIANDEFREWYTFGADNWYYGTLQEDFMKSNLFIMSPPVLSALGPAILSSSIVVFLNIGEEMRRMRLQARADADSVDRRLQADAADFGFFEDFDLEITDPLFTVESVVEGIETVDRSRRNLIKNVRTVLAPFVTSAERADSQDRDMQRQLGTSMSPEASPGWGVQRKHLDRARELCLALAPADES